MNHVRPDESHETPRVQDFLDRFGAAIVSGDGKAAAALWETPALVLGDDMTMAVATAAEVETFFAGAKEQYNKRGITGTRGRIIRLEWLTERIAVVEVRWPYLDDKGTELGEETSTYTLRSDDGGSLKLRVAVMHGEKPKH